MTYHIMFLNVVARAAKSDICREGPAAKYVLYSREQQAWHKAAQHIGSRQA